VTDSWLRLSARTGAASVDALANFLLERGAPGVVLKRRGVEAYFPRSRDDAVLKQSVRRYLHNLEKLDGGGARARLEWKIIADQNWHDSWRRFIKPRRVGKSFWVTPPWLKAPKFRRRQVIVIEPGLAFGTGTHATTRGCLEFLEQVADSLRGRSFTALDVGTGAGILAIALVKLGANRVSAIDNDPVALQVARENLIRNKVAGRVRLSGMRLNDVKGRFSVVVANLTAETILDLAKPLEKKVVAKGFLILSGLMRQKADAVLRHFRIKFHVLKQKRGREWVTLLLQKR
jgi:ribosomal protein L11 methyltransferase